MILRTLFITYGSYLVARPEVARCRLKNRFSRSIFVSPIKSSDPRRSQSYIETVRIESCGNVASNSKHLK